MIERKTDILILGAGIGGYETYRSLLKEMKKAGVEKEITLIDRNNYFTFTPMLHEVASGSIQPNQAAIPIRQFIYKTPHKFWQTEVVKVDPVKKVVRTSDGRISYEMCIVALGSKTNFMGVKGAKKHSEHVRNLSAAMHLHQRIIQALESKRRKKINIVIVGGGATGVELAGQIHYLASRDVKALYPKKKIKISVVQSRGYLMKFSHKSVQKLVEKKLRKCGVQLIFNSRVVEVLKDKVVLDGGRKMESTITIWAAGFTNSGENYVSGDFCKDGSIEVGKYLHNKKDKSLYAIGDIAYCRYGKTKHPYPKLGEIAHKEGEYVAKHITARLKGKKIKPFSHELKGELVPIGDWYAVAKIGPFSFQGQFAWWLRRTVYLAFIPGFLRKLRIVFDWTLNILGFRHIANLNLRVKKDDD